MAARAGGEHGGAWAVLSGLSLYVLIGLIAFTVWLSIPQLGGSRAERVSSFLRDTAGSVFAKDQPAGATAAADRAVPAAGIDGGASATLDGISSAGTQLQIATGGRGVRVRAACQDSASGAGAWADGTAVEVVLAGTGECAGWSLLRSHDALSWVRTTYVANVQASTP
jgi:hypothetical protein